MGAHAYARLGFGYDLGGDEGEYNLRTPIESLPWYDEDRDDLEGSAKRALLAAVGFAEDDSRWDDEYLRLHNEAWSKVGPVKFVHYGNLYTGYVGTLLLIGPSLNVNWVEKVEIPTITDEHHQQLAWVLETLGLEPDQEEPRWLLATRYGG